MVLLLQSPWQCVMRHIHTDSLGVILHNISENVCYKVNMRFYDMKNLFCVIFKGWHFYCSE